MFSFKTLYLYTLLVYYGLMIQLHAELTDPSKWKKTFHSGNILEISQAYADAMIEYGRDRYGRKHSPLFITGLDRKTLKRIRPPFPNVKRKPFMPGWERDREHRGSDLNYGHADPLDQLTLLNILEKLSILTGDEKYSQEARKRLSGG